MKAVKCACCGGSMKRNGKTSSGAQRWRCAACGASATVRYDDAAARLEEFLSWLLSKGTQLEMPGAGRTFGLIGQIMCLILGVGAGQRPFFMGKVIRIDFPTRTKSVSRY